MFFTLAGAHSNDALQGSSARSRRSWPATGTRSTRTRRCSRRVDALIARGRRSASTPSRARVLERYHATFRRAGARSSRRRRARLAEIIGAPRDARHRVQPERARRRAGLSRWCSTARPISPACRTSCAPPRRARRSERGLAGKHVITLSRSSDRAVPAHSRPGAICARRRSAPGSRAATTAARPTTRRSSPRCWRCAPSGRGCSAMPTSPTTGSTTPWRRRRRRCASCCETVWAPARARAHAERDALQALVREEGGNFALAPWDWRYYAEKLRQAASTSTRPRSSPTSARPHHRGGVRRRRAAVRPELRASARTLPPIIPTCASGRCAARTAGTSACSSATISRAPRSAAAPG